MDLLLVFLFYFACVLLAGWIIMLIAGAIGLALSYGTCVAIASGITLLKILL
jgi:hypothetical protein